VAWHQAGKDAVAVYCVAKTVAVLASSLKEGVEKEVDEIAEEVSEEVATTVRKSLDDLLDEMKSQFQKSWKFNKIGDDAFEVIDGSGTKWATVYKDRVVSPARTAVGSPGNPILNKVPLLKSMKYDVDGFIYETDELGRV